MTIAAKIQTEAEEGFSHAFSQAEFGAKQRAAFERFARAGLPTRRRESWHYSDLRGKLRAAPPLATAPGPDDLLFARAERDLRAAPETLKLVLLDGVFCAGAFRPVGRPVGHPRSRSGLAGGIRSRRHPAVGTGGARRGPIARSQRRFCARRTCDRNRRGRADRAAHRDRRALRRCRRAVAFFAQSRPSWRGREGEPARNAGGGRWGIWRQRLVSGAGSGGGARLCLPQRGRRAGRCAKYRRASRCPVAVARGCAGRRRALPAPANDQYFAGAKTPKSSFPARPC